MTFLKLTKNTIYLVCLACILLLLVTVSLNNELIFTPLAALAVSALLWTRWAITQAWRLARKATFKHNLAAGLLCFTALLGASTGTLASLEYSGLVRVDEPTLNRVAELPAVQSLNQAWADIKA